LVFKHFCENRKNALKSAREKCDSLGGRKWPISRAPSKATPTPNLTLAKWAISRKSSPLGDFRRAKIAIFRDFRGQRQVQILGFFADFREKAQNLGLALSKKGAKIAPFFGQRQAGILAHFWLARQIPAWRCPKMGQNWPFLANFGPFLGWTPARAPTFWALFLGGENGPKSGCSGWGKFPEINFSRNFPFFGFFARKTPGAR